MKKILQEKKIRGHHIDEYTVNIDVQNTDKLNLVIYKGIIYHYQVRFINIRKSIDILYHIKQNKEWKIKLLSHITSRTKYI